MTLSDNAIDRLRAAADLPDLPGMRYRVVDTLGHGGMGAVYRVEDGVLGRQVAMKIVSVPDENGELAARLLLEAKVIAQLEHPGIVPVHDVGTLPDQRVFYTMKLVQGKRLDEVLLELGTLPERLRIFQKICEAVSFAHARGVLHRDLKPQNVMIGPFGEVLVMDWGLSKILRDGNEDRKGEPHATHDVSSSSNTSHGAILGTPGFMAPEQARGEIDALSGRADIFSLGAILKFLICEGPPDTRPLPRHRALWAIVSRANAESPSDRYESVTSLAADVGAYLDGLPVKAYPEGALGAVWRWVVRNRAWILLVVAYLVMRATLILWRGR